MVGGVGVVAVDTGCGAVAVLIVPLVHLTVAVVVASVADLRRAGMDCRVGVEAVVIGDVAVGVEVERAAPLVHVAVAVVVDRVAGLVGAWVACRVGIVAVVHRERPVAVVVLAAVVDDGVAVVVVAVAGLGRARPGVGVGVVAVLAGVPTVSVDVGHHRIAALVDEPVAVVVHTVVAVLGGARVHGGVVGSAVVRIGEAVAVLVGAAVGTVGRAVAVVVEAVAGLGRAGMAGGVGVVAVHVAGGTVAVGVDRTAVVRHAVAVLIDAIGAQLWRRGVHRGIAVVAVAVRRAESVAVEVGGGRGGGDEDAHRRAGPATLAGARHARGCGFVHRARHDADRLDPSVSRRWSRQTEAACGVGGRREHVSLCPHGDAAPHDRGGVGRDQLSREAPVGRCARPRHGEPRQVLQRALDLVAVHPHRAVLHPGAAIGVEGVQPQAGGVVDHRGEGEGHGLCELQAVVVLQQRDIEQLHGVEPAARQLERGCGARVFEARHRQDGGAGHGSAGADSDQRGQLQLDPRGQQGASGLDRRSRLELGGGHLDHYRRRVICRQGDRSPEVGRRARRGGAHEGGIESQSGEERRAALVGQRSLASHLDRHSGRRKAALRAGDHEQRPGWGRVGVCRGLHRIGLRGRRAAPRQQQDHGSDHRSSRSLEVGRYCATGS